MILLPSEIILGTDPESGKATCRRLILWSSPQTGRIATIDLAKPGSWPIIEEAASWVSQLGNDELRLTPNDTAPRALDEEKIPREHRDHRDQAWEAIKDIVVAEPDCYIKMERSALINQACEKTGLSRPTIKKYLQRYWHRGCTKNSLVPDFHNCGGRGDREPGEVKRGRPVLFGSKKGVNITADIKADMRLCVESWYGKNLSRSKLKQAYEKFKTLYCHSRELEDSTGNFVAVPHPHYDENGFPTFSQFYYHVNKIAKSRRIQLKRDGKFYLRNKRGVTGSTTVRTFGPGSRYEIDATIADIYLVSVRDASLVVGRPTVYFVVDVYTRMIVGLSVTWERPSWNAAMGALVSAFMNKVDYCRQFGIEIDPEDWPCEGLPAAILYDGGELTSRHFLTLANSFNIVGEKASAYRPDWKGLVENKFNITSQSIKDEDGIGAVREEYHYRPGHDYRFDAVFNIREFTALMIWEIIEYNCFRALKKYDADKDFAATGLPYMPVNLWKWGVDMRSRPRACSINQVKYALLPKKQATVTEAGILYKQQYWTFEKAREEFWFDHARQHGRFHVEIGCDPRFPDQAVFQDSQDPDVFYALEPTDKARKYAGLTDFEIDLLEGKRKSNTADAAHKHETDRATIQMQKDALTESARERREAYFDQFGKPIPNNISEAQNEERHDERTQSGGPAALDPSYGEERPNTEPLPPADEPKARRMDKHGMSRM